MLQVIQSAGTQVPTWKELQDYVGPPHSGMKQNRNVPLTAKTGSNKNWTQDFGFCCVSFLGSCRLCDGAGRTLSCPSLEKRAVQKRAVAIFPLSHDGPVMLKSNHILDPQKSDRSARLNKSQAGNAIWDHLRTDSAFGFGKSIQARMRHLSPRDLRRVFAQNARGILSDQCPGWTCK